LPNIAPRANAKGPYRILVEDETGDVLLVFFLANHAWIEKSLPIGAKRWVSGKLELWDGHLQMVHPDRIVDEAGLAKLPMVEPVYGLTQGLFPRVVARAVAGALARVPTMPEWIEGETIAKLGWPTFGEAIARLHHPQLPSDIDPAGSAWTRLAYDELLANQLALVMMRARMRRIAGRGSVGDGRITGVIEANLPFALTSAQTKGVGGNPPRPRRTATDDATAAGRRRLRQTVVALLAMASVVEAGRQAALMAPTEILARQHHERLAPLGEKAGLRLALMTGRDTASQRNKTLDALGRGDIDIVIGTHALFQESVGFRDLGLAVIDEQHRFGVLQRLALGQKGEAVDMLVMTATPIPRTLVLTFFGDMDISTLREKPAGRQPIDTRALPLERLDEVVAGLARAIAKDARVYWICPLVDENEGARHCCPRASATPPCIRCSAIRSLSCTAR